MRFKTADLCDEFPNQVRIAASIFQNYGGVKTFGGSIATVRVFEDNALVRQALETAGDGRVLVVDGGASLRCALVGDNLAQLACDNGWAGLVVYGCIRDTAEIARIPIGVKALNSIPRRSAKSGKGATGLSLHFAGVPFHAGHYLYADADGLLVAAQDLLALPG
jgi:regulator of ribonuclease activity A